MTEFWILVSPVPSHLNIVLFHPSSCFYKEAFKRPKEYHSNVELPHKATSQLKALILVDTRINSNLYVFKAELKELTAWV